jgi:hypothetical protein
MPNLSVLKRYFKRFFIKCLIPIAVIRPAKPFRRVRFPSSPPDVKKPIPRSRFFFVVVLRAVFLHSLDPERTFAINQAAPEQ